jgi:choice-of-anchor B domain-containing protein
MISGVRLHPLRRTIMPRFRRFAAFAGVAFTFAAAAVAGALAPPAAQAQSRNVQFLSHVHSYSAYSACWSYVHSNGDEYAAIGTQTGTAFYRLTNPSAPVFVGFIAGPNSQWREMKQYQNYFYIVSEGAGAGAGLQIVSMANPNAPVLVGTYTATFLTAHTVTIDTARGLLYANGTRNLSGTALGMRVLSLANPAVPVEVGAYLGPYVHDCHVRGTLLYTAHIYEGRFRVLDVTNPALVNQPSSVVAEKMFRNPFPHNTWTSPDIKYLYVTNENTEGMMRTFDISDVSDMKEVASYRAVPGAICHNVHTRGNTMFASHYTEGVRVLDISDPSRPTEYGYYDTYPGVLTEFHGNWEVCAEFPSGIFIVSDIESGLWVFQPQSVHGIVAAKVIDQTGAMVPGAEITMIAGASGGSLVAQSATTDADGMFRVALDPGAYEYRAEKFGYEPGQAGGTMVTGATDSLVIVMQRDPYADVAGTVTSAAAGAYGPSGTALAEADLHVDDAPLEADTESDGSYGFEAIPQGVWLIHVSHPAYVPQERSIGVAGGANETQDFALQPVSIYDDSEAQGGWSLFTTGDNATTVGRWQNGDPNGTGVQQSRISGAPEIESAGSTGGPAPGPVLDHPEGEEGAGPGPVAPENDHSPGTRTRCFVTGLGAPGAAIGDHDVDTGITTLTSPNFNLTGIVDPTCAYYLWYVNDGNSFVDDVFTVQMSNNGGSSWTTVAIVSTSTYAWQRRQFRVADFLAPTATMKLRFIAADINQGSVVEAGIDDVSFYGAPATVGVPSIPGAPGASATLALLGVRPNPARGAVQLAVAAGEGARVEGVVYDVRGRLVRTLEPVVVPASGQAALAWDGADHAGRTVSAGVYVVRLSSGTQTTTARVARMEP